MSAKYPNMKKLPLMQYEKKNGRQGEGGGKPTKFNPETSAKIIEGVRRGSWLEISATAAGIDRLTLLDWLKTGNRAKEKIAREQPVTQLERLLSDFVDEVHKAQAEGEMIDLERINRAADTTWQAAAWRLERRHPERWAQRIEHSGEIRGGNVRDMISEMDDDAFNNFVDQIAERITETPQPKLLPPPPENGNGAA